MSAFILSSCNIYTSKTKNNAQVNMQVWETNVVKKAEKPDYGLYIRATPDTSRIRILNITPKYQPGIKLKPGKYNIEVSSPGYYTYKKWVTINQSQLTKNVILNKVPPKKEISNPEIKETKHNAKYTRKENSPYHALVIGNSQYEKLKDLNTASTDALDVSNLLKDEYNFNVTTLIDAKRSDILSELYNFRNKLKANDKFLIYYAGHGSLDEQSERGYWLPIDAIPSNPTNWLSNADITDTLKALKAKQVIVVADSCYSGALTRSATRGLKLEKRNTDYLAKLKDIKSRTVLSSGGLEPVSDGGGGANSVFAKAFLNSLKMNQSFMDGTQLFSQIRSEVRLNAYQTPEYQNIRFAGHQVGGDFLFIKNTSLK